MNKKVNISAIRHKMHFIYKDEREKNIAAIVIYNKDGKFFFDPEYKNEMSNLEVEALLLRGALVDRDGKYYRPSSFNENNVSFSDAVINPEDIEVDLSGYVTKDELQDAIDAIEINPTPTTKLEHIDVILEGGKTFNVPTECEPQTIELRWSKPTSSSNMIFKNSASGTLPYQIAKGYTQLAVLFGQEVTLEAYDNDGSGANVFGYIDITVGKEDIITLVGEKIFNIDGTSLANNTITASGIYLIHYQATTPRDNLINKCAINSSNGTSVINNIVLQNAYWLRTNAGVDINSRPGFVNSFPASAVVSLKPGEEFSNSGTGIAKAKFNGVEITDEVSEYNIVPDMTIQCVSGTLSFTYEIAIKISNSTNGSSWTAYKWACIGDSYTDPSINADYKYEHVIADITGIQIQTLGVGGTGWWKGYDTQSSYRFRASMVDLDTDVVTLFGSINDWKYYQGDNPLTLGTVNDTLINGDNTLSAYINDVFDALEERVPTAQIIVFGPMYYHGLANRPVELHETLKACTENRGYEYVDMLNVGWRRILDNVQYAQTYCTDYSETRETFGHPNNLAHKTFIAPKFYNKLKEYLPIM